MKTFFFDETYFSKKNENRKFEKNLKIENLEKHENRKFSKKTKISKNKSFSKNSFSKMFIF